MCPYHDVINEPKPQIRLYVICIYMDVLKMVHEVVGMRGCDPGDHGVVGFKKKSTNSEMCSVGHWLADSIGLPDGGRVANSGD